MQPQVAMAFVLRILGGGMVIKERLSHGTACEGYAQMETSHPFDLDDILISGCNRTPSFGFRPVTASYTFTSEGSPDEGLPCDCHSLKLNQAIAGRFCNGPPCIQCRRHRHQFRPTRRDLLHSLCNESTMSFIFQRLLTLAGRKLSNIT